METWIKCMKVMEAIGKIKSTHMNPSANRYCMEKMHVRNVNDRTDDEINREGQKMEDEL